MQTNSLVKSQKITVQHNNECVTANISQQVQSYIFALTQHYTHKTVHL